MQPALLRREKESARYDVEIAQAVFRDSFFAHVSFTEEDGSPQCLPMVALFEQLEGDDEPAVYLHGYPKARLMELVSQAEKESRGDEGEDGQSQSDGSGIAHEKLQEGNGENIGRRVRVCITATKVMGLVLSSAPNGHSFNYQSSTIHGYCERVADLEKKRDVMHRVTNHIISNRWEETNPVSSMQVSLVSIARVTITKFSTKVRAGGPRIQPRFPERDGPDREEPVWAGVIPLAEQLGEPVPYRGSSEEDKRSEAGGEASKELREFVEGRNARMKGLAEQAYIGMEPHEG